MNEDPDDEIGEKSEMEWNSVGLDRDPEGPTVTPDSSIGKWEKVVEEAKTINFMNEGRQDVALDAQLFGSWLDSKRKKTRHKDRVSKNEVEEFLTSSGRSYGKIAQWIEYDVDNSIDIGLLKQISECSALWRMGSDTLDLETLVSMIEASKHQPGSEDVYDSRESVPKLDHVLEALKKSSMFRNIHEYLQPKILDCSDIMQLQAAVLAEKFSEQAVTSCLAERVPSFSCIESLELSSFSDLGRDASLSGLRDSDPSTYWLSSGHLGTHWILIKCKPNTIPSSVFISVGLDDASYKPHIIELKGSENKTEFKRDLKSVVIPVDFSGEFEIKLDVEEHIPFIKVCIMRCHSDGNDVKIRGIRATGRNMELDEHRSAAEPEEVTLHWLLDILLAVVEEASPIIPSLHSKVLEACRQALDKLPCLSLARSSLDRDSIRTPLMSETTLDRVENCLLKLSQIGNEIEKKSALKLLSRMAVRRGSIRAIFTSVIRSTQMEIPEELWSSEEWSETWKSIRGKVFTAESIEEPLLFRLHSAESRNVSMVDKGKASYFSGNGQELVISIACHQSTKFYLLRKLKFRIDSFRARSIVTTLKVISDKGSVKFKSELQMENPDLYITSGIREFVLNCDLKGTDRLEIVIRYEDSGPPLTISNAEIRGIGYNSAPFINTWQDTVESSGAIQNGLCLIGSLLEHDHLLTRSELDSFSKILAKTDKVLLSTLSSMLTISLKVENRECLPLFLHIMNLLILNNKIQFQTGDDNDRKVLYTTLLSMSEGGSVAFEVTERTDRSVRIQSRRILLNGPSVFFRDVSERRTFFLQCCREMQPSAISSALFEGLCRKFATTESKELFNYGKPQFQDPEESLKTAIENWDTIISATFTLLRRADLSQKVLDYWISFVKTQLFETFSWIAWLYLNQLDDGVLDSAKQESVNILNAVLRSWTDQISALINTSEDSLESCSKFWSFLGCPYEMINGLAEALKTIPVGNLLISSQSMESFQMLCDTRMFDMVIKSAEKEKESKESPNAVKILKTWKVESAHPYNLDREKKRAQTFAFPGAVVFKIKFDPQCELDEIRESELLFRSSHGPARTFSGKALTVDTMKSGRCVNWPREISIRSRNVLVFQYGNRKFHPYDLPNNKYEEPKWGYSFTVTAMGPSKELNSSHNFVAAFFRAASLYCRSSLLHLPTTTESQADMAVKRILSQFGTEKEKLKSSLEGKTQLELFETDSASTLPDVLKPLTREIFLAFISMGSSRKIERGEDLFASASIFSHVLSRKILAKKQKIAADRNESSESIFDEAIEKAKWLQNLRTSWTLDEVKEVLSLLLMDTDGTSINHWNELLKQEIYSREKAGKALELLLTVLNRTSCRPASTLGLSFLQTLCVAGFGSGGTTVVDSQILRSLLHLIRMNQTHSLKHGFELEAMLWEESAFNLCFLENKNPSLIQILAIQTFFSTPIPYPKQQEFEETTKWLDRYKYFENLLQIVKAGRNVEDLVLDLTHPNQIFNSIYQSNPSELSFGISDPDEEEQKTIRWFYCLYRTFLSSEDNKPALLCSGCDTSILQRHIYRCTVCVEVNLCKSCFATGLFPWGHSSEHGMLMLTHQCDHCGGDIAGTRYHCSECPDFDLCHSCRFSSSPDYKAHSSDHHIQAVEAKMFYVPDPELRSLRNLSKARMWLGLHYSCISECPMSIGEVETEFSTIYRLLKERSKDWEIDSEGFDRISQSAERRDTEEQDQKEIVDGLSHEEERHIRDDDEELLSRLVSLLQKKLNNDTPNDEELKEIDQIFGLVAVAVQMLKEGDKLPVWVPKLFVALKELCHGPTCYPALPLFQNILLALGPEGSDRITNETFGTIVADVMAGYVTLNFLFSVGVWSLNNQEVEFAIVVARTIYNLHASSTPANNWNRSIAKIFKDKWMDEDDEESRFFALACLTGSLNQWQAGSIIEYRKGQNQWKRGILLDSPHTSFKYTSDRVTHTQPLDSDSIRPFKLHYSADLLNEILPETYVPDVFAKLKSGKMFGLDVFLEQKLHLLTQQTGNTAKINGNSLNQLLSVASSPTGLPVKLSLQTLEAAACHLIGIGSKDFTRAVTKVKENLAGSLPGEIIAVIEGETSEHGIPAALTMAIYESSKDQKSSRGSAVEQFRREIDRQLLSENTQPLDSLVLLRALNNYRSKSERSSETIEAKNPPRDLDQGLVKLFFSDGILEGEEKITAVAEPSNKSSKRKKNSLQAEELLFMDSIEDESDSEEEFSPEDLIQRKKMPNNNFFGCLLILEEMENLAPQNISSEQLKKRDLLKELTNRICRAITVINARLKLLQSILSLEDKETWEHWASERKEDILPLGNLLSASGNRPNSAVMKELLLLDHSGSSLVPLVRLATRFASSSIPIELGRMKIPPEAGSMSEGRIQRQFDCPKLKNLAEGTRIQVTPVEDMDGILLFDKSKIYFSNSTEASRISVDAKAPTWEPVHITFHKSSDLIVEFDVNGDNYDPDAKPYDLKFEVASPDRFYQGFHALDEFVELIGLDAEGKSPDWVANATKAVEVAWVSVVELTCKTTEDRRLKLLRMLIQILQRSTKLQVNINLNTLLPLRTLQKCSQEEKSKNRGSVRSSSALQAALTELFYTAENFARDESHPPQFYQPIWNPELQNRVIKSLVTGWASVTAISAAIDNPNKASTLIKKKP